uniref:Capsid protein n=1 Tax=Porcine serum-associated circular virus TaxID=1891204 RepID=A0A170RBS5_9VIRU|nr:capsid protein [Porcine serum-associated circular virus]
MPRYYRYKRYYKKVYPRKRWASNLKLDQTQLRVHSGGASAVSISTICKNSSEDSNPTPTILKFGRLKLKGDIRSPVNNVANFTSSNIYVIFVPEGATCDSQFILRHPEYIIAWSTLSLDSGNSFSISSSLKRNLNSGDKIQVFFSVDTTTPPQSEIFFNISWTAQFWTTTA